ncbi:hypothetical protein ACQI4L_03160 [Mycolicibacterium litorale]|uniref:hypothetical protein n=1 Tax=Mycolicibacterium litorale TaxID=758802 RepID=UPI003CEE23D2
MFGVTVGARLPSRVATIVAACAMVVALIGIGAPSAVAEPGANAPAAAPGYPELRYFTAIDPTPYAMQFPPGASLPDQPGYWFVTAQGAHCGIWFRGSFGCTGNIPGAPPGVDKLGWITGDTRVHYDWTLAIRFPPARGSTPIPPLSSISVEGTTCATTVDLSTYCERGPFRFMMTPTHTWLN